MSDPLQDLEARLGTHKQWIYVLIGVLVVAITTAYLVTSYRGKQAEEAIARATVLEPQVAAAVQAAQQKDIESAAAKAQADTLMKVAQINGQTIAQLQAQLAAAKAQRPTGTPPTAIESKQDELITAQTGQIKTLGDANASLVRALGAKTSECDSLKEALKGEKEIAANLKTAIREIPKERPWSIGLIYGRNDTGVTQYGVHGSRAFGPIHVGAVVMPHFAGVEAGLNF